MRTGKMRGERDRSRGFGGGFKLGKPRGKAKGVCSSGRTRWESIRANFNCDLRNNKNHTVLALAEVRAWKKTADPEDAAKVTGA